MNKKNLFYVILKFVPFMIGVTLYSVGIVNLVSSLFLFLGGYVTVKNLFDYRLVKKNIVSIREKINIEKNNNHDDEMIGNNDSYKQGKMIDDNIRDDIKINDSEVDDKRKMVQFIDVLEDGDDMEELLLDDGIVSRGMVRRKIKK